MDEKELNFESSVSKTRKDCTVELGEIQRGLDDLGLLSKEALTSASTIISDLIRRLHASEQSLTATQRWIDETHPETRRSGEINGTNLDKLMAIQKPGSGHDGAYAFEEEILELIAALKNTCDHLEDGINQDVLTVPTATSSSGFATKSTVGLMLNDLCIYNMVIGGPAYKCKQLEVGDEIVKVDGVKVSTDRFDDFQKALIGSDVPGSSVSITVRKPSEDGLTFDGKEVTVMLRRMAREEMADHVKMFELFTTLKEYVLEGDFSKIMHVWENKDTISGGDEEELSPEDTVDACMDLWTRMMVADSDHDDKIAQNVRELQDGSVTLLKTLREGITRLMAFVNQRRDHLNRTLTRIAWRLKNRCLAVAFDTWHDSTVNNRRMKRNMKHTLSKWKNGVLSHAFNTWTGKASETRRLRNKAVQVVGRFMHRTSAMVFTRWLESVKEHKRQEYVLKKVLNTWRNQLKSRVLHRWLEHHNHILSMRRTAAKVLARWQQGATVAAWNRWAQTHAESKRMRNLTAKVAGRFRNKYSGAAFATWFGNKEEHKHMRYVADKVMKRWSNKTLAVGFTTWYSRVADIQRAKHIKEKVARRWRLKGISAAFFRWEEFFAESVRLRTLLDKVLRRWTHQTLMAAFVLWHEHAKAQAHQAFVLEKVLKRMKNRSISLGFDTWSMRYKELKRFRSKKQLFYHSKTLLLS